MRKTASKSYFASALRRLLMVCAAVLLVAGCGGGRDTDTAEVPATAPPPAAPPAAPPPADGGGSAPPENSTTALRESLAEDALAAAFAAIRTRATATASRPPTIEDGLYSKAALEHLALAKPPGRFRGAMLLPSSGRAAAVAEEIRAGAELAMRIRAPENLDIVFIDTSAGMEAAAGAVRRHKADVVLGPLFAENTIAFRERITGRFGRTDFTVISFSNDLRAAKGRGDVYIFGQTPEQEIRTALDYALARVKRDDDGNAATADNNAAPRVAIIASEKPYGRRIADEATALLDERGLRPALRLDLTGATLANEDALQETIAAIKPPDTDTQSADAQNADTQNADAQDEADAQYDIMVIAGDIAFSLRVAPVLAWNDFDARRTRFVGTSLWSHATILQEPSLAGGIFADVPQKAKTGFAALWKRGHDTPPGRYAALGFDAVVLAAALAESGGAEVREKPQGYDGFSGRFRFNRDGSNARLLDVYEIRQGQVRVVAPAPQRFQ